MRNAFTPTDVTSGAFSSSSLVCFGAREPASYMKLSGMALASVSSRKRRFWNLSKIAAVTSSVRSPLTDSLVTVAAFSASYAMISEAASGSRSVNSALISIFPPLRQGERRRVFRRIFQFDTAAEDRPFQEEEVLGGRCRQGFGSFVSSEQEVAVSVQTVAA